MKILHFSDSHLGYHELDKLSPSGINLREQDAYDSLQKVIDIAIELQPDLVIHSGDFFHRPSPANRPMIFGLEQLSRLSKANIPIVVIAGNHETTKTKVLKPILDTLRKAEILFFTIGFAQLLEIYAGVSLAVQYAYHFPIQMWSRIDEAKSEILALSNDYRMRAIIGRSRFEAALVYKPRILGLKNEEFPFLVHTLSVI